MRPSRIDELYATYAHDPKTAAEAPRGIIVNADLIKISIKDQDRDRRDPVLIATAATEGDARDTAIMSRLDGHDSSTDICRGHQQRSGLTLRS